MAISELTPAAYTSYVAPRVRALYALEHALGDRPLDFCLLVSSLSSVLGGLGLVAYTAASLVTDAFTHQHNRSCAIPWVSVNWDVWQLSEAQPHHPALGATLAGLGISASEGMEAFGRLLSLGDAPQIVVSTGDLQARIDQWVNLAPVHAGQPGTPGELSVRHERPNLRNQYVAPGTEAERRIASIWQELLGIEQVGIHDNFFLLGGHSLLGTQLISRLREAFHVDIPLPVLFETPTVAELATEIEAALLAEIEALSDDEALLLS